MEISNIPIHDATLLKVHTIWSDKKVILFTSNFSKDHNKIVQIELEFTDVKNLYIPMEDLWGPSLSIHTITVNDFVYELQMQSGDIIKITANNFCYRII